jgi:hypothetical protein
MSAERGWIGDPQPSLEWRDSHYSRQADREATSSTSRMTGAPAVLRNASSANAL